jgi:hypothetical protein
MPILPKGPRPGFKSMLASTLTAFGFLAACMAPALASSSEKTLASSSKKELAQPERPKRHSGARERPADAGPAPAASPRSEHPVSEPSEPESRPTEPSSVPDDDEEVSPGDDPASCDGCEMAVVSLGGTLWGLFGVSRRRGVPRTVIRGLQPR